LRKGHRVQTQEAEVFLDRSERFCGCSKHGRLKPFEFVQKRTHTQNENTAVPVIVPGGQISVGRFAIGLLGKGADGESIPEVGKWRASADIAVARMWGAGPN